MKLYATISSERASKSQGGKYLGLAITNEKRRTVLTMHFETDGDKIIPSVSGGTPQIIKAMLDAFQGAHENMKEPYKGSQREMDDELFDNANAGEL